MKPVTAAAQWNLSLKRFNPEIVAVVKEALTRMRKMMPGAVELVYDNFNALVIAFGPSERASEAIFSLAIYPRWINLFFLRGAHLDDPAAVLKGSGAQVRHIRVGDASVLDQPAVRDLMKRALAQSTVAIDPKVRRRMAVRAVQAKQHPRRPEARGKSAR
jgi:hypothetical protein